jgi:hypothetical protein
MGPRKDASQAAAIQSKIAATGAKEEGIQRMEL